MKQFTLLITALLLCGLGWAQNITWTASGQGYSNGQEISSITFDGQVSATFNKGTNSNAPKYYTTGAAIRCYGGNYFTITSTGSNLSEIALTFANGEGTNAITTDVGSYSDGHWEGDAQNVTFTIGGTSGHRRIAGFEITYGGDGPTVAMPTFSPEAGTYTETQMVTLSCETEGTTIYYTTDGNAPDDESTQYTAPITVDETTTIKAIAYDADDNTSNIASATYTIVSLKTIAEVREQGTGVVYTQGVVTSCVGTTGYIQDATAAICVYGTSLTVGDEITVSGTLTTHNGLLEITNPEYTINSQGNTIEPEVMTIQAINTDYAADNALQGWLVRVENATVSAISSKNVTLAQGENTIVARFNSTDDITFAVNDVVSMTANIGCYNAAQLANPTDLEVVVNEDPVINAEDVTLTYDATSGEIAYTIDNPVEGVTLTASTTADWISNITVTDTTVTFTTTTNETTTDRTATVTLSYTGATDKTVTVTQEMVDYATLPFTFNDTNTDIENTAGLTQYSVGSYSTAPYLKFDGTGDWLILKFNDRPGVLSFDIKGNGFSDGTFTVQTSEDGESWTDLAVYDSIPGTTHSEVFSNLDENVRYIKWVYTNKANGNVALGNISLESYVEPQEFTLTIGNPEGVTITATYGTHSITNGGSGSVTSNTEVTLTLSLEEGYTLTNVYAVTDDEEEVDLFEGETDNVYTFSMPYEDVTVNAEATSTQVETLTIAQVRAQNTGDVRTIGTVTSINGKTAYIQDATAAICVYTNSNITDLVVGDNITVEGTLSTYNGLLEITNPTYSVNSQGNTIEPEVMTIGAINTDYAGDNALQGWLVRIENATVTEISSNNTYIAQGNDTIVVFKMSGVEYALNDILSLTGNIGCHNAVQIVNPTDVEVQANTTPVIAAEDLTLDYDATLGTIIYTIVNPVEGVSLTATTDADWISNITIAEEAVVFTTTVNEGTEDRTATFTLSYEGANDKTVTVTQSHYVVDYAELPFEFDGGIGDIDTVAGLTQSGLGSDYSSSPKLKFNSTDDWLILKFNERPGKLSFDINGNSFSGGTFTVQTSEDGETWTDLATYTELGTTQTEVFNGLAADVRYIRWIYTEKVNGNVGLGNIQLQPYVELQQYALTINNVDHITITATYDTDGEITEGNTGNVTEDSEVTLTLSFDEGYALENLTATTEDDIALDLVQDDENTWHFYMPQGDVTINAEAVQYFITNYTLATTIESGRHYIIVGFKDNEAFAMGKQTSNNRSGVSITANNSTATVTSEDEVYEFVINGPDAEGDYIIYDNDTASIGYLYAPSSSSNHLRTETYLDANKNGKWSIEIDTATTILAQGTSTRNWMRFNSSSNIFSCYAATSSQQDIFLYVRDEEENYEFVTDVKGYDEADQWQLIASPLTGETDPANANMLENEYDLYAFDQSETGAEWRNSKTTSFDLANGNAYLYASSADTTLHFIGQPSTNSSVTLAKADNSHGAWNLVGNPFGYAATIDRAFYVMNGEGTEIIVDTLGVVNPMQGIFVIAESDGETLTFTPADNAKRAKLVVNLSQDNRLVDRALVSFGNAKGLEKLALDDRSAKVYFTENGIDYAVVNAENRNEIPVNIKAKANANYTISINPQNIQMSYLHLTDSLTGEDVDLLQTPFYTFKTEDGKMINRFKITFF